MLQSKYLPRLHWFLKLSSFILIALGIWMVIGYLLPRLLPQAVVINANKSGIIIRNERWGGDITVVGDIWALPGTTVTLDPGTKITVRSQGDIFNLNWWPTVLGAGLNTGPKKFGVLNGELFWDERQKIDLHFAGFFALGSKEQPITIQSDTKRPGGGFDFNLISVDRGIISHGKLSNYRKLVVGDEVTIRDSEFEQTGECAVCAEYSSPSIINNIFKDTGREYIWVLSGSPKISDNLFSQSKGEGIVADPRELGQPLITHNSFEMSGSNALHFLSSAEDVGGAISFNEFAGGSFIILPCDTKLTISQNLIRGHIKFPPGSCSRVLNLGPNYWFSQDRQAILNEKILKPDSSFKVLIPYVLSLPPVQVGRRVLD